MECPHCGQQFRDNPNLSMRKVKCSSCHKDFVAGGDTAKPAGKTPPGSQVLGALPVVETASPGSGELNDISPKSVRVKTDRRRFDGGMHRPIATSLIDLFDWRFQKYLTPLIIKILWFLTVAFTVTWVISVTTGIIYVSARPYLVSDQAASPMGSPSLMQPDRRGMEFMPSEVFGVGNTSGDFQLFGIVGYLTFIFATLIGLMVARVFCESLIVAFNISSSLIEIERNTKYD